MNAVRLTRNGNTSIFSPILEVKRLPNMPRKYCRFKEYNLKRHFQTKNDNFGSNLSESKLQQKANDMVKNLKQQQTVIVKQTVIQEAATKASFVLAYKLAKQNKPFTDTEFVKECMLDAVDITCPEVRTKIEAFLCQEEL